MRKKKILIVILVLVPIFTFFALKKNSQNINEARFNKSTSSIVYTQYKINMDSLLRTYEAIKDKKGVFIFLDSLESYTEKLNQKYIAEENNKKAIILKSKNANFMKTKAGTIKKAHPEWSKLDCLKLANNYLWKGMHIEMVKYVRGNPDDVNVYRRVMTDEYEYIWRKEGISHFYTRKNGIVISYN